ncbi:iron-containing redox enzyme family protein [Mangrovitalea sediminis]|uniref:iron-containing redox enzyme family protein n=1 Tax=Mangrovitalea sediminis TaxID=1982043 RepID=UPI000BE4EA1C|nr:iron-containing redox enzyme family protein [Mangrovitalea sediminis]
MSVNLKAKSTITSLDEHTRRKTEVQRILEFRTSLVLDHPLHRIIGDDPERLLRMFELYAHFVYGFAAYVCNLFLALKDEAIKEVIYENLSEEMGFGMQGSASWKNHHGELYHQFIQSLRKTHIYRELRIQEQYPRLEGRSKVIANHFYTAHNDIVAEGNDLQSLAAFSTIECWVVDQYGFWKRSLENLGSEQSLIDTRTIDMHCVCDEEHSATLDKLIYQKSAYGEDVLFHIKKGVVRGMLASEQIFSDIARELV